MVQEVAVEHMPDTVPDFFHQGKERLVGLASQPDRWKARSLNYLRGTTSVDHYMAYEQVEGLELPPNRYDYLAQLEREGINAPGQSPQNVGTLPYRVAELYQNLALDFAVWRNEGQQLADDDPRRRALEENVLMSAGLLGHYVGDAAQPLHSTVHHDGWNTRMEPNPKGFRTRRGFHRKFETSMVRAAADEAEIHERVAPAREWEGDPLNWGLGLIAESNEHVEELYQLEKDGDLNPRNPSPEAVNFLHDRMAVGAQNLRDLWYTAWVDSEELAQEIFPPRF